MFFSSQTKDQHLQSNIQKFASKQFIYPVEIPCITRLCGTNSILCPRNVVSIYESQISTLTKLKLNLKKIKKLKVIESANSACMVADSKITMIVFNNAGYDDIPDLLLTCLNSTELKENINFIKNELKKYSRPVDVSEILDVYPVSIENNHICITINIEAIHVCKNKKIYDIKDENKIKIKNIKVCTNYSNKVISVELDNKHPNADGNNYYCLGELKLEDFNIEWVTRLIERLRMINLDDCYYTPQWFTTDRETKCI